MLIAATAGFFLGLSLIVAIGAQNAFVLRQGLRRSHVLAVCLTCAASDAALISAGVGGLGKAIGALPWLTPLMRYGGAAFLAYYGLRSLVAALSGSALDGALAMALFALGSSVSLLVGPWVLLRFGNRGNGAWGMRLAGLALAATSAWALWMGLAHDTAPWCVTP